MEASRTELRKWFVAFFLISQTDKGINAVELSTIIQVTYKTAWSILHKIRRVMNKTDQSTLLTGSISVNSAVYGRPYHSSVNKHPQENLLLVGSSLNQTGEPSYIKIKVVTSENPKDKHINQSVMKSFTKQHIDQHAKRIDFVTGFYTPKHKRPLLAFATQASKWINDTFHGLGAAYLQTYLDEFSYRLNLSIQGIPIFKHLIHQCVSMSFSDPTNTQCAA
ncbi:DDE transposase [Paenibacillus sp. GCM10027628]|uniref:DDE transposase n=1 Tax=Paenibacillus sp. GCM10027628 TaxID=3273413 RepID=UPI0036368895